MWKTGRDSVSFRITANYFWIKPGYKQKVTHEAPIFCYLLSSGIPVWGEEKPTLSRWGAGRVLRLSQYPPDERHHFHRASTPDKAILCPCSWPLKRKTRPLHFRVWAQPKTWAPSKPQEWQNNPLPVNMSDCCFFTNFSLISCFFPHRLGWWRYHGRSPASRQPPSPSYTFCLKPASNHLTQPTPPTPFCHLARHSVDVRGVASPPLSPGINPTCSTVAVLLVALAGEHWHIPS